MSQYCACRNFTTGTVLRPYCRIQTRYWQAVLAVHGDDKASPVLAWQFSIRTTCQYWAYMGITLLKTQYFNGNDKPVMDTTGISQRERYWPPVLCVYLVNTRVIMLQQYWIHSTVCVVPTSTGLIWACHYWLTSTCTSIKFRNVYKYFNQIIIFWIKIFIIFYFKILNIII